MSRGEPFLAPSTGRSALGRTRRKIRVTNAGSTLFERHTLARIVGQSGGAYLVDNPLVSGGLLDNWVLVTLPWGLGVGASGYGILAAGATIDPQNTLWARSQYGESFGGLVYPCGPQMALAGISRAMGQATRNPAIRFLGHGPMSDDAQGGGALMIAYKRLLGVIRNFYRREAIVAYSGPYGYGTPALWIGTPLGAWDSAAKIPSVYSAGWGFNVALHFCDWFRRGNEIGVVVGSSETPGISVGWKSTTGKLWQATQFHPDRTGDGYGTKYTGPWFYNELNKIAWVILKQRTVNYISASGMYYDAYVPPDPWPNGPHDTYDTYYFDYLVLRTQVPDSNPPVDIDLTSVLGWPDPWYEVEQYDSGTLDSWAWKWVWNEEWGMWEPVDIYAFTYTWYANRLNWNYSFSVWPRPAAYHDFLDSGKDQWAVGLSSFKTDYQTRRRTGGAGVIVNGSYIELVDDMDYDIDSMGVGDVSYGYATIAATSDVLFAAIVRTTCPTTPGSFETHVKIYKAVSDWGTLAAVTDWLAAPGSLLRGVIPDIVTSDPDIFYLSFEGYPNTVWRFASGALTQMTNAIFAPDAMTARGLFRAAKTASDPGQGSRTGLVYPPAGWYQTALLNNGPGDFYVPGGAINI